MASAGGLVNQVSVIGVPGEDIGAASDAGIVHELDGGLDAALSRPSTRTAPECPMRTRMATVSGPPVGFNGGSCAGAYYFPGLMIGAPGEDLAGRADAGAVTMFEPENPSDVGTLIRQGAGGVPDALEAGDRFGASISNARGSVEVAIGVPGENVGAIADAGLVTLAHIGCDPDSTEFERDVVVLGARAMTQNTTGVHDTAEAGDQFGARLATGRYRPAGGRRSRGGYRP